MTARALKCDRSPIDDTIGWYNRTAETYAADTLVRNPVELRTAFLARLPRGSLILDARSGSGRDTLAFLEAGYEVEAFDASEELAEISTLVTGRKTRVARFESFTGPQGRYDGVWAFAWLLHVAQHDLPDALDRLAHVLKPGGWLFANFKLGQGERIDGYGRHYTDMDSELLLPLFGDASGWSEVLTSVQTAEAAFGEPTGWVNLLARKSPD
ncbi:class I SAM-dependent methyltransferase [Brevundimonas aurantiaca]|uniref:class I SAM-dependent methyltransferase n=1 Tax=Brevundimonas aurantiaca TaxID=74316 RepID=UPI0017486D20|nr:class I SAM-dependent methyltransferase [Brevundimonas aurantiaca]